MEKMQSDTKIVATQDQVSTSVSGESIILNVKTGLYHGLDPIGARLWELLVEPTTFGSIVGTVMAEYDIDADTCERDLNDLLAQLSEAGLIEIGD